MTFVKELPVCIVRFGRASMVEKGDKLVPRFTIACGYRDVEPEECIICTGIQNAYVELKFDTYIQIVKGKKLKNKDWL